MRAAGHYQVHRDMHRGGRARGMLRVRPSRVARHATGSPFLVQDAITRSVAIVEEFASGLLLELTESLLPDKPALIGVMWDRESGRVTRSWDERITAWNKLHSIAIRTDFVGASALLGFVEVRNAIAHGLGHLTSRQLKTSDLYKLLAAANIDTRGTQVMVTHADVERINRIAQNFIEWLDFRAAHRAEP
jgi:hypothetical protein